MPSACPRCGGRVQREEGGVYYRCINVACPTKLEGGIRHFAGKHAHEHRRARRQARASTRRDRARQRPRGSLPPEARRRSSSSSAWARSRPKTCSARSRASKETTLDRLLNGLSIRHVGEATAKALADHFGDVEKIVSASEEDLREVRDVGPEVARAIVEFFAEPRNRDQVRRLLRGGRPAGLAEAARRKAFRQALRVHRRPRRDEPRRSAGPRRAPRRRGGLEHLEERRLRGGRRGGGLEAEEGTAARPRRSSRARVSSTSSARTERLKENPTWRHALRPASSPASTCSTSPSTSPGRRSRASWPSSAPRSSRSRSRPGGDPSRMLPFIRDGRSAYFVQQNRGKRSLCLDLVEARGARALARAGRQGRRRGRELRPRRARQARPRLRGAGRAQTRSHHGFHLRLRPHRSARRQGRLRSHGAGVLGHLPHDRRSGGTAAVRSRGHRRRRQPAFTPSARSRRRSSIAPRTGRARRSTSRSSTRSTTRTKRTFRRSPTAAAPTCRSAAARSIRSSGPTASIAARRAGSRSWCSSASGRGWSRRSTAPSSLADPRFATGRAARTEPRRADPDRRGMDGDLRERRRRAREARASPRAGGSRAVGRRHREPSVFSSARNDPTRAGSDSRRGDDSRLSAQVLRVPRAARSPGAAPRRAQRRGAARASRLRRRPRCAISPSAACSLAIGGDRVAAVRVELRIHGRVQGVFYRASAHRQARDARSRRLCARTSTTARSGSSPRERNPRSRPSSPGAGSGRRPRG